MSRPRSPLRVEEASVPERNARRDDAVLHLQTVFRDLVDQYAGGATIADGTPCGDWDPGAAEALTRVYESAAGLDASPPVQAGDAYSGGTPASPDAPEAGERDGDDGRVEETIADARFLAMSKNVEQVLVDPRPDPSLLALSLRFDDLERRVALAMRSPVPEPEGQTAEEASRAPNEPDRLDIIQNMLGHVVDSLSDERLARVLAPTAEPSPPPPSQEPEPRFASPEIDEIAERVDELFAFVRRAIDDQRRTNEALAATLASVQQTLARVLDRMDAPTPASEPAAVEARPVEVLQSRTSPCLNAGSEPRTPTRRSPWRRSIQGVRAFIGRAAARFSQAWTALVTNL